MPERGPVELLLTFQLALGGAFLGVIVWAILKWTNVV